MCRVAGLPGPVASNNPSAPQGEPGPRLNPCSHTAIITFGLGRQRPGATSSCSNDCGEEGQLGARDPCQPPPPDFLFLAFVLKMPIRAEKYRQTDNI